MADISILSRLTQGAQRNVSIADNTLVTTSIKVGGGVTNTELTKAILDRLVALQNGSDVDATYHTHDGRYFTETELGAQTNGASGASKIGIDVTPAFTNFTSGNNVQSALEGIDAALASSGAHDVKVSANDTTPGYVEDKLVVDNGSNTTNPLEASTLNDGANEDYRIRFDQSKVDHGSIAGLGDDDHTIYTKADGTRAFTGNQSMGSNRLTSVSDPTAAQDAATKAYVDSLIDGRDWKQSVKAATTAALTLASDFENGDSIDGVTLATNDRILIKDQATASENGIYIVNASGAPTRATDADTAAELVGAAVFVEQGTANGDKQFAQTGDGGTFTLNSVWVVTSANSFSGHDMIALSGGQISVDLAAVSGLESSNAGNAAGQLRVKLEASNPSLKIDGSNQLAAKLDAAGTITSGASGLTVGTDDSTIEKNSNALRVKDAGITLAKLASASVDENKIVSTSMSVTGALDGGSGTKLSVRVDDSSIEKNANNLRVKSTAYDQSTITGGSGSAAAVQSAPALKATSETAGEAYSATTLYAVRYGQNAETAGRLYKADKDATSTDNFYVIGLTKTVGALSAADPMPAITKAGLLTATSHGFTVGKPVYLDASGALTSTAPSTANHAVVKVGMVKDANTIDVQIQVMGVN